MYYSIQCAHYGFSTALKYLLIKLSTQNTCLISILLYNRDCLVNSIKKVPIFSVNNLQCIRRDNVLFQDVSFQLNKGDLVQIDGVNGSGKSTLLRICAGLTFPNYGQVFWDEKEINQCRDSYNKSMTYIGHTNGVKELLTAEENMTVMHSLYGNKEKLNSNHILEQLGIGDMDDVLLAKMSAGQKRRVALTRLLIELSDLWILDEPFTSLDINGKKNC